MHFFLTLSLPVFSSVSVHYDAEIECAVIDMMQLKNVHGNVTIERVAQN